MKPHNLAFLDNFYFHFFTCCVIELKFCEVSRSSLLNRCCNFQLPILKNLKKNTFIPEKNYDLGNRPREFQQMALAVPIFSEGFGVSLMKFAAFIPVKVTK